MTDDDLFLRAQELLHRGVRGKDSDVIEAVLRTFVAERRREHLRAVIQEGRDELHRIIHGDKK
jgi:hypothetical protein